MLHVCNIYLHVANCQKKLAVLGRAEMDSILRDLGDCICTKAKGIEAVVAHPCRFPWVRPADSTPGSHKGGPDPCPSTLPSDYCIFTSGQIIATSHDPKLWFTKVNHLISRKSRLMKYYSIWPDT